jgi:hypothetical protein
VVKLTDPRFEPTMPPYLIRVDPVRVKPLELPVRTPPALDTVMLLA